MAAASLMISSPHLRDRVVPRPLLAISIESNSSGLMMGWMQTGSSLKCLNTFLPALMFLIVLTNTNNTSFISVGRYKDAFCFVLIASNTTVSIGVCCCYKRTYIREIWSVLIARYCLYKYCISI